MKFFEFKKIEFKPGNAFDIKLDVGKKGLFYKIILEKLSIADKLLYWTTWSRLSKMYQYNAQKTFFHTTISLPKTNVMQYSYPHTIDNGGGKLLTFLRRIKDESGDYLEVENTVQPNAGPPMHVHFNQEETITVVKGKIATQVPGKEPQYFEAGATLSFKPVRTHKFWNAGSEPLIGKGFIKPAHNIEYFLTEIFASTKVNGGTRPAAFDAAYLLNRYKSEFDMSDIPPFVEKAIFPLVLFFGKLQGKHKKFKDAPKPV